MFNIIWSLLLCMPFTNEFSSLGYRPVMLQMTRTYHIWTISTWAFLFSSLCVLYNNLDPAVQQHSSTVVVENRSCLNILEYFKILSFSLQKQEFLYRRQKCMQFRKISMISNVQQTIFELCDLPDMIFISWIC